MGTVKCSGNKFHNQNKNLTTELVETASGEAQVGHEQEFPHGRSC